MVVKHCPITKVNSMLDATLMPAPAARVSKGWISLQHNRNRVGYPPDRTYNAERSGHHASTSAGMSKSSRHP